MTDQPVRWIETAQDVIVLKPDMTPDDWREVIQQMGITQEQVNRAVAALIAAAEEAA